MTQTIAFIMDPMERINAPVDTSFAFMLAGNKRDCHIVHVNPCAVECNGNDVILRGNRIEVFDSGNYFRIIESVCIKATDCAAIFVRTDPPFDKAYLTLTWMLSFAEQQGVRIINSPRGLREANEHLYGLHFPQLCPATVVSAHHRTLRDFIEQHGGQAIAKPIDGHAGFGVVRLRLSDSNCNAIMDMLTLEGKQPIIVQDIVPGSEHGDKRLLLVDGILRGVITRVPQAGEHRGNVHVGGQVRAAEITDSDRHIAATLCERLRADGLFFVGLDVIGDRLIEVNVTSPTLVRELFAIGGPDIAAEIIDKVLAYGEKQRATAS